MEFNSAFQGLIPLTRPAHAKAGVHSQNSLFAVCGGPSGTERGFSLCFSPVGTVSSMLYSSIFSITCST